MKFHRVQGLLLSLVCAVVCAAPLGAQTAPEGSPKAALDQRGFTWTETFEGSGNTDGFITDLISTVGYAFNAHFSVDMGVPYLFIQPSTSKTGTTAVNGFGDPYVGFRYAGKGPLLNYATTLNGSAPLASSTKGFSTGRATFDWTNHVDRGFDWLTPFLDLGLANSITDTRYLHRAYISFGNLAHFEGGTELDLGNKFSLSVSGYYILPWGSQQIIERGKSGSPGSKKGGPSLTRDDGVNFGVDYAASRFVDLSAGYSRSVYDALDTFSFGVGFNVAKMFQAHRSE